MHNLSNLFRFPQRIEEPNYLMRICKEAQIYIKSAQITFLN